jgi:UDP-hydrolysing UDP-N-acetyl-D-glucosamine 2-epimerase
LLGDRYETHAAATAAMLMNIPIAHIHGGEVTEGAVDEQIRHSITKMSYLHFCSTETYRQRVIQMGEDPARVFYRGAPGIDNIKNLKLLTKNKLEKELNWKLTSKSALFTYHPVTLEESDVEIDLEVILSILETFSFNILFTYANADSGGKVINQKIEEFCKIQPARYKVVKSLGQIKYLSAMKYVDLLVGNTSSGIIEAASFKKPVVNIGDRQKGRLRGENVIDCNLNSLQDSIKLALSSSFRNKIKNLNNIYGTGAAADIILDKLINEPISVIKKFRDQP